VVLWFCGFVGRLRFVGFYGFFGDFGAIWCVCGDLGILVVFGYLSFVIALLCGCLGVYGV